MEGLSHIRGDNGTRGFVDSENVDPPQCGMHYLY